MISTWTNLPKALGDQDIVDKLNHALESDAQFLAFTRTEALFKPVAFGIVSAGSEDGLSIMFANGEGSASIGDSTAPGHDFVLSAKPEQWERYFQQTPPPGYQSYWGMLRYDLNQKDIEVLGSKTDFARFAHVWRRVLEVLHDLHCGPTPLDEAEEEDVDEDHVKGQYIYIPSSLWGKTKVFVEHSGEGDLEILFLHTAGADSRQYHGVMNDHRMRSGCRMYAFDLPNHGRSFPSKLPPGAYTMTEDAYIECIAAVIKKLGVKKPLVCGASMAGQICLAVAIRNDEVGAGGVIPLEGSASCSE